MAYKAIGRSVQNYGAPTWASTISNRIWEHPQTQQNNALCTFTGCVKMSDNNYLNNKGKMLPVKAHIEMLAEEFLAGNYQGHCGDHNNQSSSHETDTK